MADSTGRNLERSVACGSYWRDVAADMSLHESCNLANGGTPSWEGVLISGQQKTERGCRADGGEGGYFQVGGARELESSFPWPLMPDANNQTETCFISIVFTHHSLIIPASISHVPAWSLLRPPDQGSDEGRFAHVGSAHHIHVAPSTLLPYSRHCRGDTGPSTSTDLEAGCAHGICR